METQAIVLLLALCCCCLCGVSCLLCLLPYDDDVTIAEHLLTLLEQDGGAGEEKATA